LKVVTNHLSQKECVTCIIVGNTGNQLPQGIRVQSKGAGNQRKDWDIAKIIITVISDTEMQYSVNRNIKKD